MHIGILIDTAISALQSACTTYIPVTHSASSNAWCVMVCSVNFRVITLKHERYKHNSHATVDTTCVVF